MGRTSSAVGFNIGYRRQTLLAFLVYLECDLQTGGLAAGRQLPGDTCSPRDARVERAGRQLCSRRALEGRLKSQAGVDGAAGCDNKPTGLREMLGVPTAAGRGGDAGEMWCGVSHVGEDVELPWGPRRQGTGMDNPSSHRRSGHRCKGFAAEPLLCGFFQPQGVFQP